VQLPDLGDRLDEVVLSAVSRLMPSSENMIAPAMTVRPKAISGEMAEKSFDRSGR
jgi:hypothetical protein